MNTPCAVTRDEIKHDLAQAPEMTKDERETAERDAIADMLRIVAPRSTSLIAAHHDGRTIVAEALSDGLDAFELKELTDNLHFGYGTGEHDDAETGRLVRKVVEEYVRAQRDFDDVVQEQHNTRLAAQAEQAELDRGEL